MCVCVHVCLSAPHMPLVSFQLSVYHVGKETLIITLFQDFNIRVLYMCVSVCLWLEKSV